MNLAPDPASLGRVTDAAMVLVDAEGRGVGASAAAELMTGRVWCGQDVDASLTPMQANGTRWPRGALLHDSGPPVFTRIRHADGHLVDVIASTAALGDGTAPRGTVLLLARAATTRAPSAALAAIAHDLRGALQTQTLGGALVALNPGLTSGERQALERMTRGTARADGALARLAALSQPVASIGLEGDLVAAWRDVIAIAVALPAARPIVLDGLPMVRGRWALTRLAEAATWTLADVDAMSDAADNTVHVTIGTRPGDDGRLDAVVRVAARNWPVDPRLAPVAAPGTAAPRLGLHLLASTVNAHGGHVEFSVDADAVTTCLIVLPGALA